jgi:Flp pilus assembly pilin Flp
LVRWQLARGRPLEEEARHYRALLLSSGVGKVAPMRKPYARFARRSGQSVVEYAIILALVAMLAVLILRGIGQTTTNSMMPVNNALQ